MTPPVAPILPVDDQNPPPVSDSIPGTNPPANPLNVDTTEHSRNLFMITLGEKDREIARLQALANQNNNPPVRQTPEEQWNQFTGAPRDMIREEVASQFTSVNQFIGEVQKEREINKLKNAYKNNPRYAPIFQYAENHLDQFLYSAQTVNTQTMELALLTISGAIATGQLQVPGLSLNLTPPVAPVVPPRNPIVPPQTPRTTTPVPVSHSEPTDTTPLTENEHRLRRSWGMTEDEYRKGKADAPLTAPQKKV